MKELFQMSFMSKKRAIKVVSEIQEFNKDNLKADTEYGVGVLIIKSSIKNLHELASLAGMAMSGKEARLEYNEATNTYRCFNATESSIPGAYIRKHGTGAVIHVQVNSKIVNELK